MVVKFRMMVMRLRYIIYMLLFLTLSCVKEQEELVVPDGEVTATISYTVVVHGSQATRASIDGDFGIGKYIFQTGDRLFIVDAATGGTNLYGVLTLSEGADTYSGTFEGTLNCVGGFSPIDGTELSATLVGVGQDEAEAPATPFFTISGDKVTAVNYPDEVPYSANLEDYVKKYSNFTSSSTFGAKSFTLEQQTVFLNFSLSHIAKACLTDPSATEIGVSIKSGEPLTTVRTFTGIPLSGGNDYVANASFTGIFKTTDNIQSGQICVEDCTIPITSDDYDGNFAADQTLVANKYYSVTRSFDPHWDGFKIKATQASTSITFNYSVQFSRDNGSSWTTYSEPLSMNAGEELCVKGTIAAFDGTNPLFTSGDNLCTISGNVGSLLGVGATPAYAFTGATKINIENGKAATLLPSTDLTASCYKEMFKGCTSLSVPPTLPATTLAASCYESMFEGCTKLASLPESFLPAGGEGGGSLAASCYKAMFKGCTGLTAFPELPATTLAESCYESMFENCTNNKLTAFPDGYVLPAGAPGEGGEPVGSLAASCYKAMFKGCTKLTALPSGLLPAKTVEAAAYYQMFNGCSALITPVTTLPATTLKGQCYYQMFQNCTKLKSAPSFPGEKGTLTGIQQCYQMFDECRALKTASGKLFTADTQLTEECFHGLFRHCYALDTVPEGFLPSLLMAKWCYRGMFEGAAFTEGPVLPATTLVNECYRFMFNTCTSLNKITCLATNPNKGAFTTNWVGGGVPSGGTFYKNASTQDDTGPDATKWPHGNSGIPSGWTVTDYVAPAP